MRVGRVRGRLWNNGVKLKKKQIPLRCLVESVKRLYGNTQSLQLYLLLQPRQHMFSIKTNCVYLPLNTLNGPGCDSHLGASAFGHKCMENYFWLRKKKCRDTAYSKKKEGGTLILWNYPCNSMSFLNNIPCFENMIGNSELRLTSISWFSFSLFCIPDDPMWLCRYWTSLQWYCVVQMN